MESTVPVLLVLAPAILALTTSTARLKIRSFVAIARIFRMERGSSIYPGSPDKTFKAITATAREAENTMLSTVSLHKSVWAIRADHS